MWRERGGGKVECVEGGRGWEGRMCVRKRVRESSVSGAELFSPPPSQSVQFQKDLYPPTCAGEPSLTASEWMAGQDCEPVMVEFTEDGIKKIAGAAKSSTAAKVAVKSSGASKEPQTLEEVRRGHHLRRPCVFVGDAILQPPALDCCH